MLVNKTFWSIKRSRKKNQKSKIKKKQEIIIKLLDIRFVTKVRTSALFYAIINLMGFSNLVLFLFTRHKLQIKLDYRLGYKRYGNDWGAKLLLAFLNVFYEKI